MRRETAPHRPQSAGVEGGGRLTSHLSRLTSHVSPLTSHLSRLTLSRLTSHVSPLTSHLSRLTHHRKTPPIPCMLLMTDLASTPLPWPHVDKVRSIEVEGSAPPAGLGGRGHRSWVSDQEGVADSGPSISHGSAGDRFGRSSWVRRRLHRSKDTRIGDAFGSPLEAVTATKQREIARVASAWIDRHGKAGDAYRMDVVGVTMGGSRPPKIEHVADAFRVGWREV